MAIWRCRPHKFASRWLVSCKHFAHSTRAVSESDEPNFLERMRAFRADGFMGFYSTLPTAGLNTRLRDLRASGDIRDYKLFDSRLIENHLLQIGYSKLMMQFLPDSYKRVRPLHLLVTDYVPLECHGCNVDLLEELNRRSYSAIIGVARQETDRDDRSHIHSIYWACKGDCDREIEEKHRKQGRTTGWEDISDLVIPVFYLRWVMTAMNRIRAGLDTYSEGAYACHKEFVIALGQKVFRDLTEEDRKRVGRLLVLSDFLGG